MTSREALLEADVDELRGEADTELARHVSSCARCQAAAGQILDGNATLHQVLDSAPALDVEAVLARARITTAHGGRRSPQEVEEHPKVRGLPGRRWHTWAGLAAAASLAALVLISEREPTLPGGSLRPLPGTQALLEAPAGQDVAVIQTDDPDITILWFF